MSAPDTNVKKQERRHKPSLLGIKGAMIFGLLMLLGVFFYSAYYGGEPTANAVTNTDQAEQGDATTPAVDPVATGTNESN